MQKDEKARLPDAENEELIDTLIAISVIAKCLAKRLRRQRDEKTEDNQNGKSERT